MKKLIAFSFYLLPAVAFAQVTGGTVATGSANLTNIAALIRSVGTIINLLLPLVVAVALLLFFWGLARFMLAAGDEAAKETGKRLMIWGIIAFVVMLSVWGIVAFVQKAFALDPNQKINIPQV